ncbi:hypothetical protein A2567_03240 [Candidatus Azambacteria bacterium RIFOXYD1_FULL_42_11]|uniref:Uncharacterized protein n=3 Tax=Candidatus Azamiibacteriota TaxID=1752741 RepID=A0A0G0Z933_9BACT|nr:MAG: hypothetical protein UV07_C0029G0002 [Candidatus Azambacteria bacterium GW2011_GWB1_42_17]KKS45205.1 MAG: hypothetical protein UV10_C0031G0003 [Candidatus Azambacteria bacterium GW2011_GWA1_42_19]OGD42036.1 MAG: hypothetical protein A2567_03240 [Candidatus Azambacteria bacterium RIFOXYD1_FULL_42_11]
MDNNPKFKIIIGIIIALLVIGGAGFWYFGGKIPFVSKEEQGAAVEVKDGLGAEALKKINNPLSGELPETNPFQVNTNPFK